MKQFILISPRTVLALPPVDFHFALNFADALMEDPKSQPTGNLPPNLPIFSSPGSHPLSLSANTSSPSAISSDPPSPPSIPTPALDPASKTVSISAGSSGSALLAAPKINDSVIPRSSIRTMESDLKSLQIGQAPKSVEVKPPVFSGEPPKTHPISTPISSTSAAGSGQINLPPSGISKPSVPSLPPPGIKLGEAEKRTSLSPVRDNPLPLSSAGLTNLPSVGGSGLKTSETKVVLPAVPPRPLPTGGTGQGGISIPSGSSVFANIFANKRLVMAVSGAGLLLILGGILFLNREQKEKAAVSPSPTFSVSPSPDLGGLPATSTLSSIFGDSSFLYIPANSRDELAGLRSEAILLSNNNFEQNVVAFVKDQKGLNYEFDDFLNHFFIGFPANLASSVENGDFSLILTKQTEFFDLDGKLIASPSAEYLLKPKIALTVRVTDVLEANSQLVFWEDTLIDNLKEFYDLSAPSGETSFSKSVYQGVQIRFVNFPYPDQAIDYAIVAAKNGNDYLIMANSRQQIFSIIDQLLGF